ncbi:MAG TPA: hypothetical protein VGZ48_01900 [Candidatus Acidoferrales bacterium]|jgi:hypothetical protein|nr:hypothetical protein [Candidatus Acidoferrales bacterium]
MPSYSNTHPPLALFPGDIGFSFSNESPAGGTAGAQFALPNPSGIPNQGHTVLWQTIFASAPTSISLSLQAAMVDADSEYSTIDTSTATAGEARTVANVRAKFLRVKCNSASGGSGYTAQILP